VNVPLCCEKVPPTLVLVDQLRLPAGFSESVTVQLYVPSPFLAHCDEFNVLGLTESCGVCGVGAVQLHATEALLPDPCPLKVKVALFALAGQFVFGTVIVTACELPAATVP